MVSPHVFQMQYVKMYWMSLTIFIFPLMPGLCGILV